MQNRAHLVVFAIAVSTVGCSSGGAVRIVTIDRPVSAKIQQYPAGKLPAGAPPSSLVRCESLPPLVITPETATIKQLLVEIQIARYSYATCANRHNVLVDFELNIEKSVIDIYNFYRKQSAE